MEERQLFSMILSRNEARTIIVFFSLSLNRLVRLPGCLQEAPSVSQNEGNLAEQIQIVQMLQPSFTLRTARTSSVPEIAFLRLLPPPPRKQEPAPFNCLKYVIFAILPLSLLRSHHMRWKIIASKRSYRI